MRRLLIVGDHPTLHRGFSTVGRNIARYLHQSGRWRVQYIGYYPRAVFEPDEPYDVVDVDADDDVHDLAQRRLRAALQSAILDGPNVSSQTLILSIGTARDQRFVLDGLDDIGLRSRVRVVGYMPVNFAPLPAASADLLSRIDVLVPFTAFAGRALHDVCPGPGPPVIARPIPHGVDPATFHPPDRAARQATRRRVFGLDEDETVLVGFFGRNSAHKHPDLAIRIFASFVTGRYSRCESCGRVMSSDCGPVDESCEPPSTCVRCGSARLVGGTAHDTARLYLHTELLTRMERRGSGGWDLERLANRRGVRGMVHFERTLSIGEGLHVSELAARMAACDVHLLPFEGGGWELTVLETAACGVANIITNVGAPPEYAASFSELVPPAARVLGPTGVRAFIDIGLGVEALLRLVNEPEHRRRLAANGPTVAAAHSWSRIGRSWEDLLAVLPPR